MRLLLEKGADVKSKNSVGQTQAARGGHKAVIKLLLKKGAGKLLYWKRLRRHC